MLNVIDEDDGETGEDDDSGAEHVKSIDSFFSVRTHRDGVIITLWSIANIGTFQPQ